MTLSVNGAWTLRKIRRRLMDGEWPSYVDPGYALYGWEDNQFGQLLTSSPTQIPTINQLFSSGWTDAFLSSTSTAARKIDNAVWIWGNNDYGQLGNGTNISTSSPIQLNGNWLTLSGFCTFRRDKIR